MEVLQPIQASAPRLMPIQRTIQAASVNSSKFNLRADVLLSRPQSHSPAPVNLRRLPLVAKKAAALNNFGDLGGHAVAPGGVA